MDDLQKTLSLTETLSRLAEKDVLSEKEASALLEAAELLKKYAQSLRRQAEEAAVEKGNTKWTEEEEKRLAKEYKGGMPVGEIAAAHRRSPSGVISRLSKLGLLSEDDANGKKRWTAEEETQLYAEFGEGLTLEEMAARHKRSMSGIIGRLSRMGLTD